MSPAEFDSLTATVLVAILLLAAVLGFVMRETRFCTVGAISDVVYLQDWGRARQWCMAIAVSMLGFTALAVPLFLTGMALAYVFLPHAIGFLFGSHFTGMKNAKMELPSSGGMGSRLKNIRYRLISANMGRNIR